MGQQLVTKVKQQNITKLLKGTHGSCLCSRALLPAGNVVKSGHMGTNSCSGSSELSARNLQLHQIYQRAHTCRKRTCLLPAVAHVMFHFKSWSFSDKNGVSDCLERLQSEGNTKTSGCQGTTGSAGRRQW